MENFAWTCPYCNHKCTIGSENNIETLNTFDLSNKYETVMGLNSSIIVCPNDECREISISSFLFKSENPKGWTYKQPHWKEYINRWDLLPLSYAKSYLDYIPDVILSDYQEACAISQLSPKASATLARRCLQGMIRDFWGISDKTLYKEINALENKVSNEVWDALNAIREIGNIGAHMHQDINVIINVEADEAKILIELLELLFDEWYIAKHERNLKLLRLQAIKDAKKEKPTSGD